MWRMRIFGKREPQGIVVKEYGRDSFLGLINPLMTFLLLGGRARQRGTAVPPRVVDNMEKDAAEMARRGYRVVSTHEYERPALGIAYFKVTYELVNRGQ